MSLRGKAVGRKSVEHFILKNKIALPVLLGIFIAVPLGYGLFRYNREQQGIEAANQIYRFQTDTFKKYREELLSPTEFVSRLRQLKEDLAGHPALWPHILTFADELIRQGRFAEAVEILEWGRKSVRHPYLRHFFLLRLIVIYEDTNRPQEAVSLLVEATDGARPAPLLPGKLYLDLGRLYTALGEVEKAKASFQYVLDNSRQGEFLRLAELIVDELQ